MSTDRMFIDYCPLPDRVFCASPNWPAVEFQAFEAIEERYSSATSPWYRYTTVRLEPTLYTYPICGRWIDQRYAWHEASRTVVVWPVRRLEPIRQWHLTRPGGWV